MSLSMSYAEILQQMSLGEDISPLESEVLENAGIILENMDALLRAVYAYMYVKGMEYPLTPVQINMQHDKEEYIHSAAMVHGVLRNIQEVIPDIEVRVARSVGLVMHPVNAEDIQAFAERAFDREEITEEIHTMLDGVASNTDPVSESASESVEEPAPDSPLPAAVSPFAEELPANDQYVAITPQGEEVVVEGPSDNIIPEMVDPQGVYWTQPATIRDAVMTEGYVWLTSNEIASLQEYSRSSPSGIYGGKCWKAHTYDVDDTPMFYPDGAPVWTLRWYAADKGPLVRIHSRLIVALREPKKEEDNG